MSAHVETPIPENIALAIGGDDATPAPSLTYVICASPRTGSTLLCSGLIRSGVAGRPRENFDDRPEVDREYKTKLGVDNDADYFDKLMRLAASPNGVRGLKVHWHQRPVLERVVKAAYEARRIAEPDLTFDGFQQQVFGPVQWLWQRRRDKVAQAVSLYRASRSRVWHHPKNKARHEDDAVVEYDFDKIDMLVHACFRYDSSWGKYFRDHHIRALTLWYEDFSASYEATMRGVLDFLGQPEAPVCPPGLNRLSDAQSLEWAERYKQDKFDGVVGAPTRARRGLDLQITA